MREDLITLSQAEHDRLLIVRKVMKREMSQVEAADLLNISDRQIRNLIRKVKAKGSKGIAHGNRGKESPRKMAEDQEERIAGIMRSRYWDFRPTFAAEKLWEIEGIKVSKEKLRQIMMAAGLWRGGRREREIYQGGGGGKIFCGRVGERGGAP